MKFFLSTLILLVMAVCAFAASESQQPVIISYPPGTPEHVLEEAKKAIIDAKGTITHEYNIITGFAAKVPSKVLDSIKTLGQKYNVLIEQDQEMSINSGH
ncbi:related to serine proteinase inhibitor IA-2 [Ramularia collo-cygni]|uniref:Related to serine proteinase inhibitor IA-2 n=1 Tax=Ramularia collo-cygni TaxID=112498 RepID=A0A2D3VH32_9PEZI|nr:related to serine proteinase inhibitor IA-2 [Ramularia collo-cygni]CZT20033.1 related to serine proteinase inhibitor IA-2 [Ramularia collo-cygni]